LIHLRDRQTWHPFFTAPLLVYLGSISYGLYVFHNGFIWLVNTWLVGQHFWFGFATAFALAIFASSLSYRYLEKPCLSLKDRWFPRG